MGRKRRTADESRQLILETAARRLKAHGLDGLNIKGVAEDAGLSHATLIHHFGSSGEMREALVDKMTLDLIADLLKAMDANQAPAELSGRVFEALAEDGHAKLLAWRAVEGSGKVADVEGATQLFGQLIERAQVALGVETEEAMRLSIFLVATAAIGFGLAGNMLAEVLNMSETEVAAFPQWVTDQLESPNSERNDADRLTD